MEEFQGSEQIIAAEPVAVAKVRMDHGANAIRYVRSDLLWTDQAERSITIAEEVQERVF